MNAPTSGGVIAVIRAIGLMIVDLVGGLVRRAGTLIADGWSLVENWLLDTKKAAYGIAVTRILLGVSAAGLMISNFRTRLYSFGSGSLWNGEGLEAKSDFPQIWVFSAFHAVMANDALYTLFYLILFALVIAFILGWRFRIVHPLFFIGWVSFIEANDMVGDQGDNMVRIVLILLFFADPAGKWSLDARRRARKGLPSADRNRSPIRNLLHNLSLVALTAQVSFVYVSGALYKAQGAPWAQGRAVYDPLATDRFGTWPWLSELLTTWGPMVAVATWGSIIIQLAFPFLLLNRFTRVIGLISVLTLHIAIGVLMGLPWFSLSMIAIDSVFIRDRSWKAMAGGVRDSFTRARQKVTSTPVPAP